MNHHRRRGFRSRPQKNGYRRRNNSQDHASQVYNISSNRNFKRNSLNPAQIEKTILKYQQLSKDAQSAGDPILSENYLQHADHFSRILSLQEVNKIKNIRRKYASSHSSKFKSNRIREIE